MVSIHGGDLMDIIFYAGVAAGVIVSILHTCFVLAVVLLLILHYDKK